MNDFVTSSRESMESMRCSSRLVPSVTTPSACVCPRVNSAEPWVRGRTPTSQEMGRISSRPRPSARSPFERICSRIVFFSMPRRISPTSFSCSATVLVLVHQRADHVLLEGRHGLLALLLVLQVQRLVDPGRGQPLDLAT